MLACARIGAPHTVIFGGFSSDALRDRIQDCEMQGPAHAGRGLPPRAASCRSRRSPTVRSRARRRSRRSSCFRRVERRERRPRRQMRDGRDLDWRRARRQSRPSAKAARALAKTPARVRRRAPVVHPLHVRARPGKPKGVAAHVARGISLGVHVTSKYVFDLQDRDLLLVHSGRRLDHRVTATSCTARSRAARRA